MTSRSLANTSAQLNKEWRRNGALTDTTYHVYNGLNGVLVKTDVLTNADSIFTDSLAPHRYAHHTTNNHYDGQGQLDSTQTLVDTIPFSGGHLATDYMAIEMYRYDALNRRVWMRNIRGANCLKQDKTSGCRSNLRRTIWDGDQVLYEIQTKGDSGWTGLEQDNYVSAPYYGTIAYTHGIGIDAPLALYKDASTTMVTPRQDLAGKFVSGDCHPTICGSLQIYWPEAEGSQFSILGTRSGGPPSWYGSIIEGGQDASGYQYKRNRYYDPQTGKFTQEDPIGLAGGLNTYGFAAADPVNFSDPFGLCPPTTPWTPQCDRGIDDVSFSTFMAVTGVFGVARVAIGAGLETLAASAAEKAAATATEKVSAIGLTKLETEGMRAFFDSEGEELGNLSKESLLKYRGAAERALSGEGGKKVTAKVIEVQTQRINWINAALDRM